MPPIVRLVGDTEYPEVFVSIKSNPAALFFGDSRRNMQIFKGIALGLLFSFLGSIGYLLLGILIGILRSGVERHHATGLSALVVGLKDGTLFNPIYWLVIAVAFALAFWITGKHHTA